MYHGDSMTPDFLYRLPIGVTPLSFATNIREKVVYRCDLLKLIFEDDLPAS